MRSILRGQTVFGGEILDAFRRSLGERELSPVTARGYLHDLGRFRAWLETEADGDSQDLRRIATVDLARYRQHLFKNRNTPPEVVVQRLASAGSADRLAKALTALGRIIKTIYILRYIQEEDLRRGVQLQLNRGEHRHILAKWLFFANRGEFRDGDINEIMNKTSCLSLLSNAVVIWNTIQMQKIVSRHQNAGQTVKQEDLARNWPLLHAHIIPNGMYDFSKC